MMGNYPGDDERMQAATAGSFTVGEESRSIVYLSLVTAATLSLIDI